MPTNELRANSIRFFILKICCRVEILNYSIGWSLIPADWDDSVDQAFRSIKVFRFDFQCKQPVIFKCSSIFWRWSVFWWFWIIEEIIIGMEKCFILWWVVFGHIRISLQTIRYLLSFYNWKFKWWQLRKFLFLYACGMHQTFTDCSDDYSSHELVLLMYES